MNKYTKIGEYFRMGSIGKEANRIEREALEDPFLYEALEGFSVLDADHEMVIKDLQRRIRGKAHRRTGRFVWFGWVAAMITIGMVAVWLLNRPEEPKRVMLVHREDSVSRKWITQVLVDSSIVKSQLDTTVSSDNPEFSEGKSYLRGKMRENIVKSTIPPLNVVNHIPDEEVRAQDKQVVISQIKVEDSVSKRRISHISKKQHCRKSDSLALIESVRPIFLRQKRIRQIPSLSPMQMKIGEMHDSEEWNKKFDHYVADSLRYPEDAREQKIEGIVVLSVHLNKKGRPSRIKLIRKLSRSCNREAIRLVEEYEGIWITENSDIVLNIPFQLENKPED